MLNGRPKLENIHKLGERMIEIALTVEIASL